MFKKISKEDAIKKVVELYKTEFKSDCRQIGIVFEKQKDVTAFLDEVKNEILKTSEKAKIWNKKTIEKYNGKAKVLGIYTENCRNPYRILSGRIIHNLFVDSKALEKHKEEIGNGVLCPQVCLNPENVENFEIESRE